MNKEEILQAITDLAQEKVVSREEVVRAYDRGNVSQSSGSSFGLAEIMYYLGGGIVVMGIGIFISQNWDALNMFTRILATLGSGVLAYGLGVMLSKQPSRVSVGQAFHLIAAAVLPIGLFVSLDEFGVDVSGFGVMTIIFAALFSLYIASYRLFRANLFALVSIAFGTGLFVVVTNWMASGTAIFEEGDFASYQALIIGVVFVLLGHSFVTQKLAPLTKYLYPVGLLFFFVSALSLGGYAPEQSYFWEIMFPGLALGSVFLSLPLRSRAFLIIGSGALVVYIFKITGEYFTDSLGWPLALILAGFAMIAVGSLFVRLNKQYKSLI